MRQRRGGNFKNSKALSQVFLREDWPCTKLADIITAHKVNSVLEVGPGLGILTKALIKSGLKVTAVEKDPRLIEPLQDLADRHPQQLTIVEGNILRFNIEEWIQNTPGIKAICGNIPYHISSSLMHWFFPHLSKLKVAVLMVQWEFGQRITSKPETKSYGSLSVYSQLRAHTHLEYQVPRACFSPRPKVDSAVISFVPKLTQENPEILTKVEQLSKLAFSQRRKKMSNSLAALLKNRDLRDFPVDLNKRCEVLDPDDFVQIAHFLNAS